MASKFVVMLQVKRLRASLIAAKEEWAVLQKQLSKGEREVEALTARMAVAMVSECCADIL